MAVETKFQDKSARVVLVDSSGPVRQLLTEVTKGVGFANSQAVSSIEDLHNILETEPIDWLVVPLAADQSTNGLHTVRMVVSFAELKGIKVSLIIEDQESWVLPAAFEFGLLSYHFKPFTKDSLRKEFEDLLRIFEQANWDATLTSAEYLRRHLTATKQSEDLLALERTLLEIYPGNADLLIHLAEALQMGGSTDLARTALRQAELIKPEASALIEQKRAALFGDETTLDAAQQSAGNLLGLQSVVVIDNDDSVRASLKTIFTDIGCSEVQDFAAGDSAFEWIDKNAEPSLIVMEWRIPNVSGPLLIQRIRSKGYVSVPIIVLSSLLRPADMGLVREMGVANIALKPMERLSFLKSVIWTIQQDRMPTEAQTVENKIRAYFSRRQINEAEDLLTRYLNDSTVTSARKSIMRAEYAFAKDNYAEARDLAIDAIRQSGDSLFALNILGKSLMVLRQFEAALKCFKKAQSMSPNNLERLVMIAETQAEMGDTEAATQSINKARDIDPESAVVREGEVKVAVAGGQASAASAIMGQLESMGNVIAYLNNKAVANARCGFADEGIQIYQKTLAALPLSRKDIQAIVTYNMALAKVRKSDFDNALKDLSSLLKLPESRVHRKAAHLQQRLSAALADNGTFALKEAEPESKPENTTGQTPQTAEASPDTATAETLINTLLDMNPGDHCCYMLFKSTAAEPPGLAPLMAKAPKFKARKHLERGITFSGAEGTKTAS